MYSAPAPCAARHFSPSSRRLLCHAVPRGASAPSRILTGSSAQQPKATARTKNAKMDFMGTSSVREETIDAGEQPARTALGHKVRELAFLHALRVDPQRLAQQSLELGAALLRHAHRFGERHVGRRMLARR